MAERRRRGGNAVRGGARVSGVSDRGAAAKALRGGRAGNATDPIATVIQLDISTAAPANGSGTGLTGQYWDNTGFTGSPKVTRTDPGVNFAWRNESVRPVASL